MNRVELVVVNKLTYFLLLIIPCAFLWAGYEVFQIIQAPSINVMDIAYPVFVSILISAVALYFFIRLNTYSSWMNPNHPKTKEEYRRIKKV